MSSGSEQEQKETEEATYRAIGRFITCFAGVEHALRFRLAEEIKLDRHYMTVIVTHDFALLCTAVTAVFSKTLKTEKERRELKRLMSKCRALNDIRVKVVHGVWSPDDGGMVAHVSRRTLSTENNENMTRVLEKEADDARQIFNDLQVLLSKYRHLNATGSLREGFLLDVDGMLHDGRLTDDDSELRGVLQAIRRHLEP
jgi:hypothetical protein